MTKHEAKIIVDALKNEGVEFEHGLSDKEVFRIEELFRIKFPDDLKTFLQTALPVGDDWVKWREGIDGKIGHLQIWGVLDWPLDSFLFDVEHNTFWPKELGERPEDPTDTWVMAFNFYYTLPQLVPIFSHRYIPHEPLLPDNPVFSVYQTDVVYYGYNLADYLAKEFRIKLPPEVHRLDKPKRHIPFWSDLANW